MVLRAARRQPEALDPPLIDEIPDRPGEPVEHHAVARPVAVRVSPGRRGQRGRKVPRGGQNRRLDHGEMGDAQLLGDVGTGDHRRVVDQGFGVTAGLPGGFHHLAQGLPPIVLDHLQRVFPRRLDGGEFLAPIPRPGIGNPALRHPRLEDRRQ